VVKKPWKTHTHREREREDARERAVIGIEYIQRRLYYSKYSHFIDSKLLKIKQRRGRMIMRGLEINVGNIV